MFGSASSLVPLFAFFGALGAVLTTILLSRFGSHSPTALLLSGVIVGSVLVSLSTYLMLRDADRMRSVLGWTLGNLALSSWETVDQALPFAVLGLGLLLSLARGLDALQLGEDTARTLGVSLRRVTFGVIAGASLATAAAVAYVGTIGFIGFGGAAHHAPRRHAR